MEVASRDVAKKILIEFFIIQLGFKVIVSIYFKMPCRRLFYSVKNYVLKSYAREHPALSDLSKYDSGL